VRLIVKLAEAVNGVDLSHCHEGDVIELSPREAAMLIAEGWPEAVDNAQIATCHTALIEAELFGIEERTATGVRGRRGKFEYAYRNPWSKTEIAACSLSLIRPFTLTKALMKRAYPVC
jgi:hypothetical protein